MSETAIDNLCIHTVTTKPWNLEECITNFSAKGVRAITIWKELFEHCSIAHARKMLDDCGMVVAGLCRGGFFVAEDAALREEAITRSRREIELAHEIGAPVIVLVCGASPRVPLCEARKQITDAIAAVMDEAKAANVALAIEPLHPMYADCRSAVSTLKQANDMCDALGAENVGVAVDVFHTWWDDCLQSEMMRSGRSGYLYSLHLCDWKTPMEDMLNDRGLMGEGCIPNAQIRRWAQDAGFSGFDEVEIFSLRHWAGDQHVFLQKIIDAYKAI